MHVDDIFAAGLKNGCDILCDYLNCQTSVKNLDELKWYGGCRYLRNRERGTLTISQKNIAEGLVKTFRVISVQSVPLGVSEKILVRMTRLKTGRFLNSLVV